MGIAALREPVLLARLAKKNRLFCLPSGSFFVAYIVLSPNYGLKLMTNVHDIKISNVYYTVHSTWNTVL